MCSQLNNTHGHINIPLKQSMASLSGGYQGLICQICVLKIYNPFFTCSFRILLCLIFDRQNYLSHIFIISYFHYPIFSISHIFIIPYFHYPIFSLSHIFIIPYFHYPIFSISHIFNIPYFQYPILSLSHIFNIPYFHPSIPQPVAPPPEGKVYERCLFCHNCILRTTSCKRIVCPRDTW